MKTFQRTYKKGSIIFTVETQFQPILCINSYTCGSIDKQLFDYNPYDSTDLATRMGENYDYKTYTN